jgi:hypothetical protein
MLEGQYKSLVRCLQHRRENGRQDVSPDVARELRQRCDLQMRDVPFFLQYFSKQYEGHYRLPLFDPVNMRRPPEIDVIRKAYELWELSGKPEGRDQEFYLQALLELQAALTDQALDQPE